MALSHFVLPAIRLVQLKEHHMNLVMNPVLTPELALMLSRGEVCEDDLAEDDLQSIEYNATSAIFTDQLTISDEEEYLPGTPELEKTLRRSGIKGAHDPSILSEQWTLYVAIYDTATHKEKRVKVWRQPTGDKLL